MPPPSPSSPNGHDGVPEALRKPPPHPVPSLAAQMAEADAERDAAAKAELQARTAELHDHIAAMLATDPAAFVMNLPALLGASLVEAVAAGVQIGFTRAMEQMAQQQAQQEQAPKDAPSPLLRVTGTGNVHQAAQAAMGGMPLPGPPQ